jgi:hypothetical protein
VNDRTGKREALAVGEYFYQGQLTEGWTFGAAPADVAAQYEPFMITYARRTFAGWVAAVLEAGLVLEAIAEPRADEEMADSHPEVADTRIVPYFLIMRARRSSSER